MLDIIVIQNLILHRLLIQFSKITLQPQGHRCKTIQQYTPLLVLALENTITQLVGTVVALATRLSLLMGQIFPITSMLDP